MSQNYLARLEAPGDQLTDLDRIAVASALAPMLDSEGWAVFAALCRKLRQEGLERGVHDDTKDRAYFRGYIAAIDEIAQLAITKVEEGRQLQAASDRPRRPVISAGTFRPGGGGFGTAG